MTMSNSTEYDVRIHVEVTSVAPSREICTGEQARTTTSLERVRSLYLELAVPFLK